MMELHKWMFPDSEIAAHMTIKQKKYATLVQRLGQYASHELTNNITKSKLSILIDESKKCTSKKTCCCGAAC